MLLGWIGVMVLIVWVFPSTTDFRAQNPFWHGINVFAEALQATPLDSLAELPANSRGSVAVVIPYKKFSLADNEHLMSYILDGGRVILADDFRHGNEVLEGLGINAKFNGGLLVDPLFNEPNSSFPVASIVPESAYSDGVSLLGLNYATGLEGDALNVVARSSVFSFLDTDGDGVLDQSEPAGPHTVAGYMEMGSGRLILLSDPSILINTMVPAKDNEQFIRNLVSAPNFDGRVFIDESHLPSSRLDSGKATLIAIQMFLLQSGTLSGLITLLVLAALIPLWWRGKEQ